MPELPPPTRRLVVPAALRPLWRAPLRAEVLVLLAAALAVQVVFRYRSDWPAHLVGGGGGALLVAVLVPPGGRRLAGAAGWVAMAGLGLALEHLLFGPLDLVDVSFTAAGALVAVDGATTVAAAGLRVRAWATAWGLALVALALAYRYGMERGPTWR